jgi:hypothetical protein
MLYLYLGVERPTTCPQRNEEHVDSDPLLAKLKDVAEQGFFDHLQLAEWDRMGHVLLALEERIQRINFVDLLCHSLGKIGSVHLKFLQDTLQGPPLPLQMPGSGQEGMLPAHSIVRTNTPTAATGLDDTRHHKGWAQKWIVIWLQGGMCNRGRLNVHCVGTYYSN